MNPFFQALSQGYNPQQIIQHLTQAFPKLAPRINYARKAGHTVDQILEFFSDKLEDEMANKYVNSNRIELKKRQEYQEKAKKIIKGGVFLGTTAISALALGRAIPKALQGLGTLAQSRSSGTSSPPPMPPKQPPPFNPLIGLNQPKSPIPNQPGPQSGVNQPAQALKQTMQLPAPQIPNQSQQAVPSSAAIELPQKPPVASKSDRLWDVLTTNKRINTGDPQDNEFLRIAKRLQKVGDIQDRAQFEDLYKQYEFTKTKTYRPGDLEKYMDFVTKQMKQKNTPEMTPKQVQPEIGNLEEKVESTIPIEQKQEKELALSPSGKIGELESSENGIAKLNLDGKVKAYKDAEVVREPIEARKAVYDILEIPEKDRSGPLDLVNYDTVDRNLYVQFPSGKVVVYKDVDPETANAIRIGKGVPKTSGKTVTGEQWTAGIADSRGAEFSQRIAQNPKYSKQNQGKTWYYLDDIYDKLGAIRLKPKPKGQKRPAKPKQLGKRSKGK